MKNGEYELVVAPPDYPGKRYRGRYVYEHHLVWWRNTGQLVPAGHDIHHKDGDKRHNAFDNLEVKTHGQHCGDHTRARSKKLHTWRCPCAECKQRNRQRYYEWRWRTGRRRKRVPLELSR